MKFDEAASYLLEDKPCAIRRKTWKPGAAVAWIHESDNGDPSLRFFADPTAQAADCRRGIAIAAVFDEHTYSADNWEVIEWPPNPE